MCHRGTNVRYHWYRTPAPRRPDHGPPPPAGGRQRRSLPTRGAGQGGTPGAGEGVEQTGAQPRPGIGISLPDRRRIPKGFHPFTPLHPATFSACACVVLLARPSLPAPFSLVVLAALVVSVSASRGIQGQATRRGSQKSGVPIAHSGMPAGTASSTRTNGTTFERSSDGCRVATSTPCGRSLARRR